MKYEYIKTLNEVDFRTITGLKVKTFNKMLEILEKDEQAKKARGGRPNKNSLANRLLMACEYWREYRTYLHIAASFGVNKSTVCRTIKWVEDVLIKDGIFSLPGKKELAKDDIKYEIILVDASESPIQRPKKNRKNGTAEKIGGTV